MALSSRSLITKTGINTTQVFDMGGINISGGDFNLGSTIKLGNASGIITATSFSGAFASTKLSVSGISTFQNNVHLLDNDKLQIGGSVGTVDGLELYHDGSNSYISETGTGALIIDSPNTIFQDGKKVVLGTDSDVQLYHDNSHGYISNSTGNLRINSDALRLRSLTGSENYLKADVNGTVELYHNNVKTFQTSTHGCQIFAPEGGSAQVYIYADEGDDNADLWGFIASHTASKFSLVNYASGSYEDSIVANGDGSVELYHDNIKRLETSSNGLTVTGRVDPAADSTHDLGTTSVRWRNLYADTLYGDGSNLTGISAGTSLSGSTNDTICTVTGANAITGEANLTFNGTNLLTVHVPSATGEPAINFTNSDTGTGTGNGFGIGISGSESPYIYNRENTAIRIATNNTERLRIHADGQISINSPNTPEAQVDIYQSGQSSTTLSMLIGANEGGAGGQGRTNSNAKAARIGCPHYTNAEESLNIVTAYSGATTNNLYWGGGTGVMNSATSHHFYTAANNTTTGGTERLRIASAGQIGLGGANYGTSGQVLTSQGSGSAVQWATPSSGLSYAQQWHLTSNGNVSANTDNVLPTDAGTWEKRSQATNHAGTVGSDMSYSSGVFTFPATGIWRIDFYGYWGIGSSDSDHNLRSYIQTTINNSSFSNVQEQVQSIKSDSTYTYQGWFQTFIFDVTSTSNCKVRFVLNPSGSNCYYKASNSPPQTGALFMRLGDT